MGTIRSGVLICAACRPKCWWGHFCPGPVRSAPQQRTRATCLLPVALLLCWLTVKGSRPGQYRHHIFKVTEDYCYMSNWKNPNWLYYLNAAAAFSNNENLQVVSLELPIGAHKPPNIPHWGRCKKAINRSKCRLVFSAKNVCRELKLSFYERNQFQHRAFFMISSQPSFHTAFYSDLKKEPPHPHFYSWTPFLSATVSHYVLPFLTELQSTEEDSQDESPVESVPIRGKKASLVPQHSHCPYVVVCFLPTAVNNGLFYAMAEAGWSRWIQGQSPTWRAVLVLSNYLRENTSCVFSLVRGILAKLINAGPA